jgi:integrase/recombinase XerD
LFAKTLDRPDVVKRLCRVPVPRKLPLVLNVDEVKRLIDACHSPKYTTALSVAYGAGLRISEVVALKVSDIDSKRMVLIIEQGKGKKDRLAKLSPALLACLRGWYKYAQAQSLMLKGGWLFSGQQPYNPMSKRQLSRGCFAAAKDAGIEKRVSMHTLRHSFAGSRCGYQNYPNPAWTQQTRYHCAYTQVATKLIDKVVSPLDAPSMKPKKDDE